MPRTRTHAFQLASLAATAALTAGIAAPGVAAKPPKSPYAYTVADLPIPDESYPEAIALDYEYDTLYVLDGNSDTAYLIDATSGAVRESVSGVEANVLAVDITAHVAYAYSTFTGALTAIDRHGSTRSVDGMGTGVRKIAVDPRTHEIYGTVRLGNAVRVVAADGGSVATIPVGDTPFDIAVDDVARRAYVADVRDATVTVIDLDTHAVTATVAVGGLPAHVAVDAVSRRAYVLNLEDDTMSVIDESTNRVVDTFSVPFDGGADDLAVDQVTHTAYVAVGDPRVLTVDLTSGIVSTITTPQPTFEVVADPIRHIALSLEGKDDDITIQQITQLVKQRAQVTGLSATTGSTAGGEQVTITGDHFAGATKVTFGATPATSFTVESDERIVVTVPARKAGKVNVRVKTLGNSAPGRTSRYTYVAPAG